MNPIRDEWRSEDGAVRLILGDCLDVLPTLSGIDAVVTDPPYGIGDKWQGGCWRTVYGRLWDGTTPEWDKSPAIREVAECLKIGTQHVIWGGNYYWLPPTNAWLIWDKLQEHSGSECEMAWTDLAQPIRRFGLSRVEAYCNRERKVHPNQKPLPLMEWAVAFTSGLVADPMMGSGTTGVACVRAKRPFVGIELDREHWQTAVSRVRAELERFPLFEAASRPRQLELLDAGDVSVSVDCPE
jgi:site-specific DNA-methyltransferase (adenine-specific)